MKTTLPLLFVLFAAAARAAEPGYHFVETKGEYTDLKFGDRTVLRFVNKPHDGTSENTHYMSFKPFHQVFDPATGTVNLSSGAHPLTKEFVFPHHRGIFFGFNKITYGDKQAADNLQGTKNDLSTVDKTLEQKAKGDKQTADIWHGTKKVFSTVDKTIEQKADTNSATQTAAISWHGSDGKEFATEQRTVKVDNVSGGTQIDWSTTLTTKLPLVKLDGDPQHAGFHFRANQEVAQKIEAEKELAKKEGRKAKPADTYYLRPDGKGKDGETRNWDAKKPDPKTINLPWNAMSFVVAGKRYTALRINHPDNPKETRGSERDYGRFGDYFEYDLTPEKPLKLKYRVWVQEGEMTVEQCEAKAKAFVGGK